MDKINIYSLDYNMKKILKSIKIVPENNFTAETSTVYFVNAQNDSDNTNGYILFDGKKYGYGKDKELVSNKVTELTSACTNTQYVGAKCMYDIVGNIESLLEDLL